MSGAGAATAYEYQHKEAPGELEEDFKEGRFSREECPERKEAIRERSLVPWSRPPLSLVLLGGCW